MQVTKTTEEKVERSLVPFKEQIKEIPSKVGKFFTTNKKRAMIIAASVFVIVAAIGINWMLFGQNSAAAGPSVNNEQNKNDADKKPVDASANESEDPKSFFALAVTDRQRARDEAIEVLQTVVDNEKASGEERSAASAAISRIASYIEAEANIEMLVKGKGFEECVAVVSEDGASIIVGTEDTLMANELAQIKEIVYLQAGVDPSAMRISERILEKKS